MKNGCRETVMASPLYQVVIETVVDRIATGVWPPGALLPSETQLGAELGVSQGTARKALMALEARGLVQRRQGRGTVVTLRTPDSALFHFFRLRRLDGSQARPELIREAVRCRRARRVERDALYGAPAKVFEIDRVRALDGRPSVVETSVVSAELFPGLDAQAPLPNTLYVHYQQAYRIIVVGADEALRAVAADANVAATLGRDLGTPLLAVDRRTIDVQGRIVEWRRSVCATDAMTYQIALE
jgi:GntR family transcriptional regulator